MAYDGPQIKLSGITAENDLRLFQYHFVKVSGDGIVDACDSAADIPVGVLQNTPNAGQAADITVIGETKMAIEGTKATGVLTSDDTIVTAADTVTVGGIVYTFRTTLTPANYEVLAVTDADTSLTNLAHAINGTGGTPGTDYVVPAANPKVTSSTVSAHAITVTAILAGTAGNAIATTEVSTHLAWGGAVLSGGLGVSAGNAIGTGASGKADTKTVSTDAGEYVAGQIVEIAANVGELATAIINCASPHTAD